MKERIFGWAVSCARRYKDGWIWFDQFGKDYGPWRTKKEATTLGPQHAVKEEKLLRRAI